MTEPSWLPMGTNVHKGLKPSKIVPKIIRLGTVLTPRLYSVSIIFQSLYICLRFLFLIHVPVFKKCWIWFHLDSANSHFPPLGLALGWAKPQSQSHVAQ